MIIGYHKEKLKLSDDALIVMRAYSLIILKNDLLINQTYMKDYQTSVIKISELFDIDYEKLDFLIDCISGHPTDVFKVFPSTPYYSL